MTIDTEGHVGTDPISHLILGNTPEGIYGIQRIIDIFKEEFVFCKILFFLDFAEVWDFGEEKILDVIKCIKANGHDIGVHIHPDHMADSNRQFLWQYSYDEQYDIIKKCTDKYEELVGHKPLSFRAGKYGADRNTLEILSDLGYKYDFSQFYGNKWCGINPPVSKNSIAKYKSIIEIPVTMHVSVRLFGKNLRIDKLDAEFMLPSEFQYAIKQICKTDLDNITIFFLHSFSLLEWSKDPDNPKVSKKKENRIRSAINSVKNNEDFVFIGEEDIDKYAVFSKLQVDNPIVWKNRFKGLFYTYCKAKLFYSRNKKAKMLVLSVRALLITVVIVLILIVYI